MPSLAGRSSPVGWWLFPSAGGRSFPPHLVALSSFPLVLVIPFFPSVAVPSFSRRLVVPSVERLVFVPVDHFASGSRLFIRRIYQWRASTLFYIHKSVTLL